MDFRMRAALAVLMLCAGEPPYQDADGATQIRAFIPGAGT